MKHATDPTLDEIEELLGALRVVGELKERKRGVFYFRSRAFLHFHEDAGGIYADVRGPKDWERLAIGSAGDRARLLERVEQLIDTAHQGSSMTSSSKLGSGRAAG